MVKHVHYDDRADILYIVVGDGPVEDAVEVDEDVFVELDENGDVVGIEVWRASRNILEPISRVLALRIREMVRLRRA